MTNHLVKIMENKKWLDALEYARQGRLDQWLVKRLPNDWHNVTLDAGNNLLYLASHHERNERALCILINKGFNINTKPILLDVAYSGPISYLYILCAAGANFRIANMFGATALAIAICQKRWDHVAVLIANGMRLRDIHSDYQNRIDAYSRRMEQNLFRLRSMVVALLRVKKVGNLWRWDKFLLKEIALSVWSTRYEFIKSL